MMLYQFVYVKINYACGHEAIRPALIGYVGARDLRSPDRCAHCTGLYERRQELRQYEVPVPVEMEEEVSA